MNKAIPTQRRPNIMLIMTDQQRYDQIGYASNGAFDTPHLDRLARQGTIFENAYSTSTVCVPSRCSLLTGILHHRLPTRDEGLNRWLALREGFWTVAHCLKQASYETALSGKMHFSPIHARHGFDRMRICESLTTGAGYADGDMDDYHLWLMQNGRADWRGTHMFGPGQEKQAEDYRTRGTAVPFHYDSKFHPTSWVSRETVEFLKKRDPETPFFLVCSFRHPHAPYDPPEPYASMFRPADIRLPSDGRSVNDELPGPFREAMLAPSNYPEPLMRKVLSYVRALVKQIDDGVGQILQHVDLDSTYVFFTSDHGDYGGHRGLRGKTPWIPFDDLSRVPFFCVGPTVPKGRRVTNLVQNYDFAMTSLELAGLEPPAPVFDAVSLTHFFRPGKVPNDRIVYCATTPVLGWPMIRMGDLKYIRHGPLGQEVLFDLGRDPGETRSLIGERKYAEPLDGFRKLLAQQLSREVPVLTGYGG